MYEDQELVDLENDLPRTIYAVPDKFWEFEAFGRESHPGACVQANMHEQLAVLVLGSDFNRRSVSHVLIQPSHENGLTKETAFGLEPKSFALRKIGLLHFDRKLGILSTEDHEKLLTALAYQFREDSEEG